MITGKQIFDKLQWAAHIYGPGSAEFSYGNLLFEALRLHGEDLLFPLLEEAESTGKRIDLFYPPVEDGSDLTPPAILILS
jgi:hypothetical protein